MVQRGGERNPNAFLMAPRRSLSEVATSKTKGLEDLKTELQPWRDSCERLGALSRQNDKVAVLQNPFSRPWVNLSPEAKFIHPMKKTLGADPLNGKNRMIFMHIHGLLLFPHGDGGWHWGMELLDPDNQRQRKRLDQRVFHRYHLHPRPNQYNVIFRCGRLFQQYVVDAWAVGDQNKLNWVREHQSELRAEVYNGLVAAIA